jgi:hypothetical protein
METGNAKNGRVQVQNGKWRMAAVLPLSSGDSDAGVNSQVAIQMQE